MTESLLSGRNPDFIGNAETLRDRVNLAYSAAADAPGDKHPFPVGTAFAQELGYPQDLLDRIPAESTEAFAGVSNVSIQAPVREGMLVLDLGCGAGLDSLIAAERVAPTGKVIGIDFSASMLDRANRSARRSGWGNFMFVRAAAEQLPFDNATVDLVMVNGIFNLNPFREHILAEIFRVLRPGGQVFGAELILNSILPEHLQSGDMNWFS